MSGEIGTTKLFENDRVVVWEAVLAPGENLGVHTHKNSYLAYIIEGSTVESLDADGNVTAEVEVETGSVLYIGMEGDELVMGESRFPATHDARNVGPNIVRELLVELK